MSGRAFQADARRMHADEPAAAGRLASHRRMQLVVGVLGCVLAVAVVAHLVGGGEAGARLAAGRRGGAVVLEEAVKSAAERDAELKAADEEFCAEFNGFLKSDCMAKREKDRSAPKYWNANEVRNGLWKTEKALADLEIRQYKHGKERDMMHKEHEQKLDKFKQRMEVALTLIHQIQDEMGTRHSQLVERLKADIISTQARLKQYLDEGVEHVNGKVAILEEREAALTERLLEMVQAQYEMLNEQVDQVHAKEVTKDQNVHAFIEGVEAAQQAGDLRIEEAINVTRTKFEALKAREIEHYAGLNTQKDAQADKQAADVVEATTKIDTDVAALRANLTATLTADKADIRSKLQTGWTEANSSLAQLALDAEAAASAIDSRLSVQKAAQDANNAEQDDLIGTLESDLHVFNLTVFDEIIKMEGNATRFEQQLAEAESTIRGEQEAQKAEILAHINSAIAAVEAVHKSDKAQMEGDVAWMKPKTAKVAKELQEAIDAIEAQRAQDLAFLTGKLAGNISAVNATYQKKHATEKAKAESAVQALALALGKRRAEISAEDNTRTKDLGDRMTDFKAFADSNNNDQGARLAALRSNFTTEAARRMAELLALESRAENVRAAMEAARARLLDEHNVDMALAKTHLSTTLSQLITDITELVQREVVTTDGSISGDLHTQTRALNRLSSRIEEEDARLNATEHEVRATFEESKNRTETRIAEDNTRLTRDRARWDANTALGGNLHAWLDSNITGQFQRLDDERVVILASLKWDLAAGLASVTARVERELAAIESRQGTRLAGNKQEVVTLLQTLTNLQEQLDLNATAQVGHLQQVQAARDAAHSRVVAALESGLNADKSKVKNEINDFNATFNEAVARNTKAQGDVRQDMTDDERKVRTGFGNSLADMRVRLNAMIARSNVTELEDLAENVREVMMKAAKLSWHLGARGTDLRALLKTVTEEQEKLFGEEGARLQEIKEEEVRAFQEHTEELSVLRSRVANEENQLTEESFKLHQDLLNWDSTARDAVPPAVMAMETRIDSNLRAQGTKYKGALTTKVATQLARAQQQRSNEEATLSQLASELQEAKELLHGSHIPEETSLVDNAAQTVNTTTAIIKQTLAAVEPVLSSLQTRLAAVYDSIRSQHAEAQAKVNEDVRKGIASLGDEGIGEVSKEKLLLEALVAENMAEPEKGLAMLQARLNGLDTNFRNDMSAEKQLHGQQHDEVRVRLGKMERELRESNSNLTSYVSGLQEELGNWKTESQRALTKLEKKQGDDKESFLRSLLATKSDVRGALRNLRTKFTSALNDLVGKINTAQGALTAAHQQLKSTQERDKVTIRSDVKEGVNSLQQNTLAKLTAKGNEEKQNIQTIINAKQQLVQELTKSTNKLIDAMRNRVKLAVSSESSDNQGQENQLTSNDAIMNRWIRNSAANQNTLEARLDRIEERVRRRQERSESEQNIMVAQLASKLQRQVTWLNSTFASENSAMVSTVQGSLGQKMAKLEKMLGAVRAKTLSRLSAQKVALEALDTRQANAIRSMQDDLGKLQQRLATVENYSRGRTSSLVQDTLEAEAALRERLHNMMVSRKQQTERIKTETDNTYDRLQDDWTRRVEQQRDWLTQSIDTSTVRLDRRLRVLSTQLSNTITGLDTKLSQLSQHNDVKQVWLKARIASQDIQELETQVANTLDASKSGVVSFTADTSALEEQTKTEVEELERKIDQNQGISVSTDELVRTLNALKRDVSALQTQESARDTDLKGRVATAKTSADSTEGYLDSQLQRLERMLTHDSNVRRRGRSQIAAKSEAYQMRMDRYRGDLTRINATWNAMDAGESPQGGAAAVFDAPPTPPDLVMGSDEKAPLNAWCARFRDRGAGYAIAKQIQVLEKCYEQDCEQSLEGGHINRPDRPGCRFLDPNGFCFVHGAAQMWCRDNERSPACTDGGARWAAPPLGIAASANAALWEPLSKAGAGGATIKCSCMKNCGCGSSSCSCVTADVTPIGDGAQAFMPLLEAPINVRSSKAGKCDCKCLAA